MSVISYTSIAINSQVALRQQADEDDQPVELIGGEEGVDTGEGAVQGRDHQREEGSWN